MQYAAFDAMVADELAQRLLKTVCVQVYHVLHQLIYDHFLHGFALPEGEHLLADLLLAHLINMGDLVTILVQQGNIEQGLQFFITVITDIRTASLRFQQVIALLPHSNGMGLDP